MERLIGNIVIDNEYNELIEDLEKEYSLNNKKIEDSKAIIEKTKEE